jgi:peptidyl-dipeptidase A
MRKFAVGAAALAALCLVFLAGVAGADDSPFDATGKPASIWDPKSLQRRMADQGKPEPPPEKPASEPKGPRASSPRPAAPHPPPSAAMANMPAAAAAFVEHVDAEDRALYPQTSAAEWIGETYITEDTQLLMSRAVERALTQQSRQLEDAKRFVDVAGLNPDVQRQLMLLKTSNAMPPPSDPQLREQMARLASKLDGEYGAGKYCPPGGGRCRTLDQLEEVLDHSRDPWDLAEAWSGWHSAGRPMRDDYARLVDLMNQGARELGYRNAGELWRDGYDMPPAQFAGETDRLWTQVKPLYTQLQCYVRTRLHQKYGDLVPENGLIPADLLGNMWAQDWSHIYDLVEPYPVVSPQDVGGELQKRHDELRQRMLAEFRSRYAAAHPGATPTLEQEADVAHDADIAFARDMARIAEDFYTSLGFPPLPQSFYDKSMLVRPRDREAVCHASAWDMDLQDDVRIKMCARPDEESLETLHHEMGHVYYDLMYSPLPYLYQAGANDAFHEAIGDTITLSLTPQHLQKIGLMPPLKDDQETLIDAQMKRALAKIAFLPFGKLIDQWRWDVFSGAIKPADYEKSWWRLREEYQGVKAPVPRGVDDFDPGAKYHIPANTPYMRYFLSFILQFQFQKALCDAAGFHGPLYACDIYGSKAAGEKFMAMLKAGASKPWQQTLQQLSGSRDFDAGPLLDYFQPLMQYLQQQNAGKACGWTEDADPLETSSALAPRPAPTSGAPAQAPPAASSVTAPPAAPPAAAGPPASTATPAVAAPAGAAPPSPAADGAAAGTKAPAD